MAESKSKGGAFAYNVSTTRYPQGTKFVKRKDGTMYAKPPANKSKKK